DFCAMTATATAATAGPMTARASCHADGEMPSAALTAPAAATNAGHVCTSSSVQTENSGQAASTIGKSRICPLCGADLGSTFVPAPTQFSKALFSPAKPASGGKLT